MTQYTEMVEKRNEQLKEEAYARGVSGFEITINKPEGIHHFTTYYRNGSQIRSYKDKRKKDEVIIEGRF
jgi:hypothetical protein